MSVTVDERTNLDGSIASRDTIWPLAGVPVGSAVHAPGASMQGLTVGDFDLTIWGYTEAELTEIASLARTDLRGADLTGVKLDEVSIDGSILTDANLSGAVFGDRPPQNVVINAGTRVDRAQLGAFVDIDERPLTLSFAARFDDLELYDVRVSDPAAIRESSFVRTRITGADFTGVELRAVDFAGATLSDVRFTNAQLDGTRFPAADLTGVAVAELRAANSFDGNPTKEPVIYDKATKWPAGFDGSKVWGWVDAHGPIDVRDPAVVAAPERAVEIAPYGRYRPALMNWILKGVDLNGPSEEATEAVTPSVLENMQLRGVSLRNRSFDESKLFFCEFHGVDLRGSSFRRTNVAGCNLETVILSPPDRSQSQFGFTQYQGMIYDDNTRFPPGFEVPADAIKLPGSIAGQELIGVDIGGNPIPGTDAHGAVLDNATLSGVDFRGSNFAGASIADKAQANGVVLAGVPLVGADLSTSNFGGADLQGADLQRANLTGTILTGADLRGADLRGATLDGADLRGASLYGALIDDGALAAAIIDDTTML